MMRAVGILGLVLLLGGAALMGPAQLQRLQINEEESSVRVSWVMQSEEGITYFMVKRKAPYQDDFEPVKDGVSERITALHQPGTEYTVIDRGLYKGAIEEVQYRLEAYGSNGSLLASWNESIAYQPTAVRRTWGSIKAMFQ